MYYQETIIIIRMMDLPSRPPASIRDVTVGTCSSHALDGMGCPSSDTCYCRGGASNTCSRTNSSRPRSQRKALPRPSFHHSRALRSSFNHLTSHPPTAATRIRCITLAADPHISDAPAAPRRRHMAQVCLEQSGEDVGRSMPRNLSAFASISLA